MKRHEKGAPTAQEGRDDAAEREQKWCWTSQWNGRFLLRGRRGPDCPPYGSQYHRSCHCGTCRCQCVRSCRRCLWLARSAAFSALVTAPHVDASLCADRSALPRPRCLIAYDDEDDDEASKGRSKSKGRNIRKLKSATSATVTALLTQALSSNDPWQLNAALQVTDRRVVEGTVRALRELDAGRDEEEDDDGSATTKYVPALMAHLVRRMARKPSLATSLGVWVRAVLAATAGSVQRTLGARGNASSAEEERMAREGRELAAKLGPLRNFLNERVESFPQLLRLEGRLALLGEEL
mmetsp:Transcript_58780/g.124805  ORF Transcript_58780/g.124805 Transcript_58780/m.124805 type:complete len:295 (+) Transcript_58780:34-918(+)